MDLQLEISPVDRDDSDEISFTGSTTDVDPIGGERVEHQGNDPFLGIGQSPVTSASSVSTSSWLFRRSEERRNSHEKTLMAIPIFGIAMSRTDLKLEVHVRDIQALIN